MQAEHTRSTSKSAQGQNGARLGGARADFVAGLGKKVSDLRTAFGRVRGKADDLRTRDELRRKLHALASAAKMMKFDAMDRAIGEALGAIDRSPVDEALDAADLDAIEQLIEDLPALAWGDGIARSSRAESTDEGPKHAVLVVGSAHIAEALLEEDPRGKKLRFACESTPDAQAAFDLVRTTEPDLVVLDADLPCATELVEALMDDPLTETVPIIVVGSFLEPSEASRYVAMGVARTVVKPMTRNALRDVCEETLSPGRSVAATYAVLGDPTLEELSDRLAAEIREALVGRSDASVRSQRISLGQGTEVLGAVWGAIARVREVVTSRSDGQIRFAGGPAGAFTPAAVLHDPELARSDRSRSTRRGAASEVRLEGRRVVIADDDPGVVWFLADLLKTAGCTVFEAFDGKKALELAYSTSPDLVISDILMPQMDGFSLCRALRRDVALRDTPVILLSWKEDLLQRVRELGADAAGYVRKESDTRAIIARVREALTARGRIEARLREDGEVRGRLDGVSIKTLLDVVCATRPDARVSVRDASFLYEVEIRMGAPHRVSRTDGDGGFVKGAQILTQMLGVGAGRFTVTTSNSSIEAELEGNLAAQLAKPIARARAAVSLLTGPQVNAVARIRFDELGLVDYLKATPERARLVTRRLANGASPSELVLCGGYEPALLDDLLCDLASRGLVIGIDGADGEDMLKPVVAMHLQHSDTRATFAPRIGTPSPEPAVVEPPEPPVATNDCASDISAAICTSPAPSQASSPVEPMFPFGTPPSIVVDVRPAFEEYSGTPPAEQIIALGEATVIDDTFYASESMPPAMSATIEESIPIPEPESFERAYDLTPFNTVTSEDIEASRIPEKRRAWPMIAFVAATGIVAWAVLHFSTHPLGLPKQLQSQPPAAEMALPPSPTVADQDKADEVFYTALAAETKVSPGEGVIDVTAPEGAAVLVDGTERAKGSAAVTLSPGRHDVRVRRAPAEERGCTIDVHTSRVAHVRF